MVKYEIKDFLEVKSSYGSRFNPDASKVAYLSNSSGTAQIFIVSREGGDLVQLTNFPDPVSGFIYSPTEEKIVFSKSEGGDENNQLYILDPINRQVVPLTDQKGTRHNLGSFSWDGKYVSYASNKRNGKDFDVYIMDIDSCESRCIFDMGDWCGALGFSPSGKYLTVGRASSNVNNDIYLCNLVDGTTEHVTPHKGDALYGEVRWLPDESSFFITSDQDLEFASLARYVIADKTFRYVLKLNWDIDGTMISRDGKHLFIKVNEDGYQKLSVYDPGTMELLRSTFPEGEIGGFNASLDSRYLTFSLGSSTRTTDVWVSNIDGAETKQITHSYQGVPPEMLVSPELMRFKSFDGLEVPAFVYKPQNMEPDKKLPVVINIHGGPESQYRPSLALISQYFVHAGYIVVAPNVRGSAGYGKSYLKLDDVEKRMDSVKDIIALRDHLKDFPEVDMNNIILMGGSYGGFMVLACMSFYPDLWAGGVDTVGIVNFITFLENTAPYRRALRESEYGSLTKDRELLESISPINSIEKIKAPLFVIHGANDPRVPLSEAEQVVNKLKELGRKVELIVYPDEGHGLVKLKNRLDAYPRVVEFLAKCYVVDNSKSL
ncbi:MAG: S9 family peptidase [Candidatus Pacebacteria bacterium]|nr:S9 family peptidase [Candidatus Paceibacterota bacterium]